ncbi:MAG: DNA methyltransferase, partial [Candidatus Muiribacteriota bacterium]
EVGHSQEAKQKLNELFDGKAVFDYPKSVRLIQRIIELYSNENSIILDFFAGSSTTAHAVMQLNAEDGGNRKYIMVQLPEPCDEKSEAFKAGYKNICEIGKERIRRAGEKILKENKDKEGIQNLDTGFKVFKLDSTNIKEWTGNIDNIEETLYDYIENIKKDRNEEDILFEVLLKYGIDLSVKIETFEHQNKKIYSAGYGALILCLEKEITVDLVNFICEKIKELNPEEPRVVFKDTGFKTDVIKTNAMQILKKNKIEDVKSI